MSSASKAVVVSTIGLFGGMGRTTATLLMAKCLGSAFGKRVLVVDVDPHMELTHALLGNMASQIIANQKTAFHLFNDPQSFECSSAMLEVHHGQSVFFIPSDPRLVEIEGRIAEESNALKATLQSIGENLDFVLIDCPSNFGVFTRNAMEASDLYIIPIMPRMSSEASIQQSLMEIDRKTNELLVSKPFCLGGLFNRCDNNDTTRRFVQDAINSAFETSGKKCPPLFMNAIPDLDSIDQSEPHLSQWIVEVTREFLEKAKEFCKSRL